MQQAVTLGEAQPFQDESANWWTQLNTIAQGVVKHRERQNGQNQMVKLLECCTLTATNLPDKAGSILTKMEPTFESVLRILRTLDSQSDLVVRKLAVLVKKTSRRAQARAMSASLYRFKKWVDTPEALGCLHKSIKDQPIQPQKAMTEQGEYTSSPKEIIDSKFLSGKPYGRRQFQALTTWTWLLKRPEEQQQWIHCCLWNLMISDEQQKE